MYMHKPNEYMYLDWLKLILEVYQASIYWCEEIEESLPQAATVLSASWKSKEPYRNGLKLERNFLHDWVQWRQRNFKYQEGLRSPPKIFSRKAIKIIPSHWKKSNNRIKLLFITWMFNSSEKKEWQQGNPKQDIEENSAQFPSLCAIKRIPVRFKLRDARKGDEKFRRSGVKGSWFRS